MDSDCSGKKSESPFVILLGNHAVPEDWPVKGEASRTFREKLYNGFFATYMAGEVILDVGYRGYDDDPVSIFPHAIGVDLDFPGYDGVALPFPDESVDTVYSSHTLEHIADYRTAIRDWHRVVKPGGFVVCIVPHQFLYEKKYALPSLWNADHKRFYTPASLLREFEESLAPNTYRVRHLRDCDEGYTYDLGPERHAGGGYEIELVIEKIKRPAWSLAGSSRETTTCSAASSPATRWFEATIGTAIKRIFGGRPIAWWQYLYTSTLRCRYRRSHRIR
ncbi:MAG TPA: class I SAM-dependent methyltransferase [Stellaceae bacterium]|nr:class I SAM-dependent methyltransferase [Stellaceae bacterium]